MKIVIVEDNENEGSKLAEALSGMAEEIVLITESSPVLRPVFKRGEMPPIQEVIQQIKSADLILLDYDLSTSYSGRDLLAFCEGKKVIGISSTFSLGQRNFSSKELLCIRDSGVVENQRRALRKLVEEVISS